MARRNSAKRNETVCSTSIAKTKDKGVDKAVSRETGTTATSRLLL